MEKENKNLEKAYHFTVKKVSKDYEEMHFARNEMKNLCLKK